jgi:cyclopropane-fatty-acyl-phospholipid synthase
MTTTALTPERSLLPSLSPLACGSAADSCWRSRVARSVAGVMAARVPVDVVLPDGEVLGRPARDLARPALQVHRPEAFFERLAHDPKVGVGEAYMAGDWSAAPGTDLGDALTPYALRIRELLPVWMRKLRFLTDRRHQPEFRNTPEGARDNIEAHYDLSNEMFETFLDETLSYSSARFDPALPMSEQTLEDAQVRKVHGLLDMLGVQEGTRLLEIGTGWGFLAVEAALRGAEVVTLTLSPEQAAYARERAEGAGVADAVDIRLQDYREVTGTFDAVVSVEMIEAVGEEFWGEYFAKIDEVLAPGGQAAIQAIIMDHDRYLTARRSTGWINKHIFPGGMIPSLRAIDQVLGRTSLQVAEVDQFGADYAETLRRWRHTFIERWDRVAALGFDEVFRRRWEFYLAFCEAGFAGGAIDVAWLRLDRRPQR